jgi:hypothetical protein
MLVCTKMSAPLFQGMPILSVVRYVLKYWWSVALAGLCTGVRIVPGYG